MNMELPKKEKKKGPEALLQDVSRRTDELNNKRRRKWISEEEYGVERQKLDEERDEILTRP